MLERIRVTLWDALTFFLTGFLVVAVIAAFWIYETSPNLSEVSSFLPDLSASIVLFIVPALFTLLGLLVEPFANYFDRWVLKYTLKKLLFPTDVHAEEERILVKEIRENYLGGLGDRITNPFQICKDYVESKSLSTTFEIFLARYGFYRNCSFIAVVAGAYGIVTSETLCGRLVFGSAAVGLAYVFSRRSVDFYGYQAPAVFRAFLIDKLSWNKGSSLAKSEGGQSSEARD